ncbi:recombinase family protein [Vallitalea sediminicola]
MKKAALYVRVSTSHQIDKDSLPFQRQELTNYSKYVLGIDDFEIFEDAGYSAKNTDRPKYQEMMARIKNKEFTHILVWKIDRISRNLKDFTEMYEELKEQDIIFISKNEQFDTSCAMGEAMLKIILVFAELERKLTGERVFSIMLSRAEKGLWNGATVPLGYNWSKEKKFPVMDEKEAHTVRYIYNLYEEQASTSRVAHQLNSERIKTKRNGKWTAKTIRDVLRNPFYIGTYRYNTKDNKRRYKNENEWVVVENNHPALISKEQFERVNNMLTDNYRGNGKFQRENTNTHIFSKMLVCGKCGSSFNAGLDRARKNGYRPSRYTCYSNQYNDNTSNINCNNFVSDITLLPFVLNYISNFINLQNKITRKHSFRDMERILLRGDCFVDVECIDRQGLEETYKAFTFSFKDSLDVTDKDNKKNVLNFKMESLKKEKTKHETALERLEDLFLFDEIPMPKKDYIFKKREITEKLDKINTELSQLHKQNTDLNIITDIEFLKRANDFLIGQNMIDKKNIDYRELLKVVDNSLIRDYIQIAIKEIVIVDKKVYSITFHNGIVHKFMYKPIEKRKIPSREKFLYLTHENKIVEFLQNNESISRKDIEELTSMGRNGAISIINELLSRDIIIKKGNSVATRYYLKKTTK